MNKSLAKLAKGKGVAVKKTQPLKKSIDDTTANVIIETETQTLSNDEKAKQKVEELLKDVSVDLNIGEKKSNIEDKVSDDIVPEKVLNNDLNNIEWLTEQIDLLTIENQRLNSELNQIKESGIGDVNKEVRYNTFLLFNELQNNLLGINPENTSWTTANIRHLLNKMLALFPYLNEYKKF